jgi:hypothetical protein
VRGVFVYGVPAPFIPVEIPLPQTGGFFVCFWLEKHIMVYALLLDGRRRIACQNARKRIRVVEGRGTYPSAQGKQGVAKCQSTTLPLWTGYVGSIWKFIVLWGLLPIYQLRCKLQPPQRAGENPAANKSALPKKLSPR